MRKFQAMHPTDGIPGVPDTVNTILLAAATAQAADWPSGANMLRTTFMSTAGVVAGGFVNFYSTGAAIPGTGSSVSSLTSAGSTRYDGVNVPVLGQATFQLPAESSGFSVIAPSSCRVNMEFWAK